jgi:muramoyltetrapeptide carboxypeptidase
MKTSRRNFIRQAGALTAISMARPGTVAGTSLTVSALTVPPVKPGPLKKGDLIGLVTPGSPVTAEQLSQTFEKLEKLGFRTTYNDSVLSEYGYFAGTDQERAEELMEMFSRKDIDGIWCVRGGYGSIRILDRLDYNVISENPKPFIGYSDITAIHTAIFKETGLVTFHGPLGISDFNRFTIQSLRKAVMETGKQRELDYRREKGSRQNPEFDHYTIRDGRAEGLLTGGNLSVLDSLIGSRFEPDFSGRIVYIEEVEEKTYRVDKMLFHLLSATNLTQASGIVLGVFSECNINDEPRLTLRQAIHDLLEPLGIPVSYGHSFGHIDHMVTIPNGIRASLDAGRQELSLLEGAVKEG